MADPDHSETPIQSDGQQARAGETSGHVRSVLFISLALVIIVFALLIWGPYLFHQ